MWAGVKTMVDLERGAAFVEKYKDGARVWKGGTFTGYLNLRALLEELPVSEAAEASRDYARRYDGISENVYGELIHNLLAFEVYLKDKACRIEACLVDPIVREASYLYRFGIRYVTKTGEERLRTYEVARSGESRFIFYADPLKA
jgi:hypothetical protein